MAEPQRAKIRVTGVVKRSSVPAAEAWSPAHRGSTASATAVASAARVVNAQVNPQASPAKALNQSQPISEHSSSTSVATREPSPVTGEKATQEVRKRPISAQSRVVVCNLSKENKESKDAPVLQELKDKEKLKSENERLKMELSKALSPKEKKMLLAEKTNLLQVLQIEKDCLEKRCVALEKQLIVDAKSMRNDFSRSGTRGNNLRRRRNFSTQGAKPWRSNWHAAKVRHARWAGLTVRVWQWLCLKIDPTRGIP